MFENLSLKDILIIAIPVFLILIFLLSFFKTINRTEYYSKYLPNEEFSGFITKKYIDCNNRNTQTIEILEKSKSKLISTNEWKTLWNRSDINDYIIKRKKLKYLFLI